MSRRGRPQAAVLSRRICAIRFLSVVALRFCAHKVCINRQHRGPIRLDAFWRLFVAREGSQRRQSILTTKGTTRKDSGSAYFAIISLTSALTLEVVYIGGVSRASRAAASRHRRQKNLSYGCRGLCTYSVALSVVRTNFLSALFLSSSIYIISQISKKVKFSWLFPAEIYVPRRQWILEGVC